MKQSYAIARSTAGLFSLSTVNPLFGMVLAVTLAWAFGASSLMDAYRVAALILVFGMQIFFGQLIVSIIIPLIADFRAKKQDEEGWRTTFTIVFIISFLALPLIVAIASYPEVLQRLLGPGLNDITAQQAQVLIRFFVLAFFVFVWTGVMNGLLQAYQIFWVQPVTQTITNVCLIILILLIGHGKGILALGTGILAGAFISLCLYLWVVRRVATRNNIHLSACIRIRISPGILIALKLAVPIAGLIIATHWYLVVINRSLSGLATGTLANFGYALKLLLFGSLLPITFATVLFPNLAKFAAEKDWTNHHNIAERALRFMIFISVPITALLLLVREPLTTIIFERGMLGKESIRQISNMLLVLFPIIPAAALNQLLFKLSYSVKNTTAPFFQQLIIAVGLTILAPLSAIHWGAQGVILTYTLLMWFSVFLLAIYLQQRYIFWHAKPFFKFLWRFGLATFVLLILAFLSNELLTYFLSSNFIGYLFQITGVFSFAGVGFIFISHKLNIGETKNLWDWMHSIWVNASSGFVKLASGRMKCSEVK